ncbi:LysR family transcriptional regulator [Acetobacter sp. TBRC 12305]|uniref:LysR family transcriptional regulator n=1 Tax=Acetobacter garciniae TaxID=2817435 RepID=A0A939KR20_9PROT|nr:LysR family transcriptional regulator [Acetobacter garciniae]MBX0345084.1 LysR family transcriptional regulator [Acetobacter garciniae]
MTFDWNDLRIFLELSRQGRLTPTARRLKVDTATVSRRIAELERALELRLFDRSASGFTLTKAGEWLLPKAEAIQSHANEIALGLDGNGAATGCVRIAMMEGIGSQYVACRIGDLSANHPGLMVELVTSPMILNLTRREADISLSFVPISGPRLTIKPIGKFSLFLYASPDYLARRGVPRTMADLKNHDFVDYVEDLIQIREVHWLLDVIKNPRVVFRSSSMLAQQAAAAHGAGLAFLPSFSAEPDKRLVSVMKTVARAERSIYLGIHDELDGLPRIRIVSKFLEDMIRNDTRFLMQT